MKPTARTVRKRMSKARRRKSPKCNNRELHQKQAEKKQKRLEKEAKKQKKAEKQSPEPDLT